MPRECHVIAMGLALPLRTTDYPAAVRLGPQMGVQRQLSRHQGKFA
jgi:hypothetical protein